MGHTPFGYKIENGLAVINTDAATQIKELYENYLSGLSLSGAAKKAGIVTYHGTVKRMLQNEHYLGDTYYPAIIDSDTFQKAKSEQKKRAEALGRIRAPKAKIPVAIPMIFTMKPVVENHTDPIVQAEYLYSLIESEVN